MPPLFWKAIVVSLKTAAMASHMKSPEECQLQMSSVIDVNDLTNVTLLAGSPLHQVDLVEPEHLLELCKVVLPLYHGGQHVLVLSDGLVQ